MKLAKEWLKEVKERHMTLTGFLCFLIPFMPVPVLLMAGEGFSPIKPLWLSIPISIGYGIMLLYFTPRLFMERKETILKSEESK